MDSSFSDLLDTLYEIGNPSFDISSSPIQNKFMNFFLSEYGSKFTNFADDTTPDECSRNYDKVINRLEDILKKLLNWFQCNNFKASASKCHSSPHHLKQLR